MSSGVFRGVQQHKAKFGFWSPLVDIVVRVHAVNDSALPQFEMTQMRYRVTRSVKAIYGRVSKEYGSSHCTILLPVVLYYVVPRRPCIFKLSEKEDNHKVG